jgi:hypothetical protein
LGDFQLPRDLRQPSASPRLRVNIFVLLPSSRLRAFAPSREQFYGGVRSAPAHESKTTGPMFLFFFNRIGCLASLLISAIGTLLILLLLGWIRS